MRLPSQLALLPEIDHGCVNRTVAHALFDVLDAQSVIEPNQSSSMRQAMGCYSWALGARLGQVMIDPAANRSRIQSLTIATMPV